MGRSRGGLTTKIHAVVDAEGMPIALKLTAGQAHDGRIRPVTAPWREPWLAGDLSDARTSVGKVRSGFLDGDHHRG